MVYDTSRELLYEQIEEICHLFPNKDVGEIMSIATDNSFYHLSNKDLLKTLRDFYLQNM